MLFGKLPVHGDFVARGLAATERDALDAWLATSLADARAVLDADFEASYDSAPPWRYVAQESAGLAAGALAPSVDSVGRRFPILLACAGLEPAEAEDMAAQCEGLLYEAFENGWDADTLAEAAGRITPKATEPAAPGDRWWTFGGNDFGPAEIAGARPPSLIRKILDTRGGSA